MGDTTVGEQQGAGNHAILTKIDKLRELIGTGVDLPQLVVVGDQSSGKSSVLEGLTGFAFPRDAELCTRYATQITCRREMQESITVSIIANQDSPAHEQQRVKAFRRTLTEMCPESLAQLFKDANEAMGIRSSAKGGESSDFDRPTFSEHILRIEKSGPNEEHFTVIDVPGIFRDQTDGLTTEADIELVRRMVKKYMEHHRTIILAIIPSNVDPATQEILKLAKEADSTMTRTMAVLTKPDLAVERTTQQIAIEHVLGNRRSLTLGYYIVRNRGPEESHLTLEQGQAAERMFFESAPWSILRKTDKAGMDALKLRVRELLIDLIKKEFPKLKAEFAKNLSRLRNERDEMGPSRSDSHTQRAYLNRMSEEFQSLVRDALDANYTQGRIFEDRPALRLVTRVVEENERYATKMAIRGHMRSFESKAAVEAKSPIKFDNGDESSEEDESSEQDGYTELDVSDELEVLFDPTDTIMPSLSGPSSIGQYIEGVYKSSRGQELGTFGSRLLGTMFKEQSKKWEAMTLRHMKQITIHVHHFISEVMKEICPDPRVRDELWSGYLLEELQERYRKALAHVKFLLEIEREGTPLTLNHYFNDNLQKVQSDRMMKEVADQSCIALVDGERGCFLNPKQLRQLAVNQTNSEHLREYMHDVLHSYYKVSRKRFVDVVCQQAVNHHLLAGRDSPLRVFRTEMVLGLNEEQLDMIAAEDAPVKLRRERLGRDIQNFEAALRVLRGSSSTSA
ncbi:P-loop containing nucleoside triphosphate hydrolase protein [Xylariaceae sp. FL0804]|nr:P-loop containing nucleoside triphosphate hydrolase protein [Xylariaceae sp. FL0804]